MILSALSIILLVQIIHIQSETCITPKNEAGECTSLYSCPKLINLLSTQGADDYVRKSRCGVKNTDPLVCCPIETENNCTTPNKKEGTCTLLSACPELLKLVASQQRYSIEYVRKSQCTVTSSDVFVCCPVKAQQLETSTRAKDDSFLVPSRRYCGYQHSDDYDTKGHGTGISEFPWIAGLYYVSKSGSYMNQCQGTIINARYILTAGHCARLTIEPILKYINLGEYNINNSTDCVDVDGFTECSDPVQEYGIEEVKVHPQFTSWSNDIALIRLNRTISSYTDYIRPICLPLPGTKIPQTGDKVITTGWGRTLTEQRSDVKKKVFNDVISNESCEMLYKNKISSINISDNHMCTIEHPDNVDFSCSGDSGSPVMFSIKSQWYVEGISSFGSKMCGDKFPVVHTKVSKYIDWILTNMKPW